MLLSKGADPNKVARMFEADEFVDQSTPLYYAAAGGYPDIREAGSGPIEVVRSLLASGARQDLDTGGGDHISSLLLSIMVVMNNKIKVNLVFTITDPWNPRRPRNNSLGGGRRYGKR